MKFSYDSETKEVRITTDEKPEQLHIFINYDIHFFNKSNVTIDNTMIFSIDLQLKKEIKR